MEKCEKFKDIPFSMMKRFKDHPLIIKALDVPKRSVLDLGCGFPLQLSLLYHDFNFRNLAGVDSASDESLISEYVRHFEKSGKPIGPFSNLYELYLTQVIFEPDKDPEDVGKKHMTPEEFEKNILIHPYDIKSFLKIYWGKQFDFVIMSHILPLFTYQEQKQIFDKANELLKTGGIIFVKANHEDNIQCPAQYTHSHSSFQLLVKEYETLCFCESDNDNGPGIKSLSYFGIKK
jgi:2-polyprenyl-3-methyl-5-hydroxy-6-metoxy-1,4-benzoquinol methylase